MEKQLLGYNTKDLFQWFNRTQIIDNRKGKIYVITYENYNFSEILRIYNQEGPTTDTIIDGKPSEFPEYQRNIDQYVIQHCPNSINTYLSKKWNDWQLIKFIYAYDEEYGGHDHRQLDIYSPLAFKAFRIPESNKGVNFEYHINAPARYVTGWEDIIFGLPDEVLQKTQGGNDTSTHEYLGNAVLFSRGKKRQISSMVSHSTVAFTVIVEIETSE